jgi:hypothetical protein
VGDNPYQDQTARNTDKHWLDDQKPVDLNLEGMAEFAKNMVTIKENLNSHKNYVTDALASLPSKAWEGGVLPEAAYARKMMLDNFADFQQYLLQLSTALNNIGMAAQTIADAFSGEDEWNAATLDAVNWAFGDPSAQRPPGLSQFVSGKTYYDAYFEQLEKSSESTNTAGVRWTQQEPITHSYGPYTETIQRATAPDGRVMEIRTVSVPGGGTTITTRLLSPDGKVLSETRQQKYTYLDGNSVVTETTNYDANGNKTGSTTKRTNPSTGDETTTQYDAHGNQTSQHSTVTHSDGTQTTTTTTTDDKGHQHVTQRLETGKNTAGADATDPAQEAIERLQQG